MSESVSLIGKLRHGGTSQTGIGGKTEAVLEHLEILLNSRHGMCAHLPDYGLPDINTVFKGYPESIEMLRKAIQTAVEKYEPRLEGVQVRILEDPRQSHDRIFRATYSVTGYIHDEDERMRVQFRTTVADTGRAKVE